MANARMSTLIEVAGARRAGAELTQAIKDAGGARGTGIVWATLAKWVDAGLLTKDVSAGIRSPRYFLTQAGVDEAKRGRAAQRLAAARKREKDRKRRPTRGRRAA